MSKAPKNRFSFLWNSARITRQHGVAWGEERASARIVEELLIPDYVTLVIPVTTPRSALLAGRFAWFELDCVYTTPGRMRPPPFSH